MQFALEQAKLDQEGIANQISSLKTQLTTLNKEKKNASKDDQYSYTVQIQSVEAQIKVQEYESSKKKSEIDKLQESLNNADVVSEVEGIVKEVNSSSRTDPSGQAAAFISVLSSGEYRIKGTVSELNFASIFEGQAVTVHSRLDPNQVWKGTVESIDQEATSDQNNSFGYYYDGMGGGEKSSKYNFYVLLENLDGLILGQHVYIEPRIRKRKVCGFLLCISPTMMKAALSGPKMTRTSWRSAWFFWEITIPETICMRSKAALPRWIPLPIPMKI